MKFVLLFNTRNQSYTVIEHNLEDMEAHRQTNDLRKQGLPAYSHDQPSSHEGIAERCSECRRLIEATIEKGGS